MVFTFTTSEIASMPQANEKVYLVDIHLEELTLMQNKK